MINRIVIMANLTQDPELRYTPQGSPVCNLRLANNRTYKVKEEKKKEACFFTAVVWGASAENCNTYLKKGSKVVVDGRLQMRSWTDNEGKNRSVLEVVAETVQFLDNKKLEQDFSEEEQ